MTVFEELHRFTVAGNPDRVRELTRQALDEGHAPGDIIDGALIPAMLEVGDKYERAEFFMPEMLVAAHAMTGAMEILQPLLVGTGHKPVGRIVIGTVQGDLHDIGKNLVAMMFKGAGFEVEDLGTNVAPEQFVQAAKETGADVVGLSALLSTTMQNMKETVSLLESEGVRDSVKVLVGGAPVTHDFAETIGADGHAPDANSAVRTAKTLLGIS
jgi:5-methyltetrahydrofolate--homocysteine methyltransferase